MLRRPRASARGRRVLAPFRACIRRALGAALAALSIGLLTFSPPAPGGGSSPPAARIAAGYQPGGTISGSELRPATRSESALSGAGSPGKSRLVLTYYVSLDLQTVAPGGAQLFEIHCPKEGEQPLTGGVLAAVPGLIMVNSSRTSPSADFPTNPRAWYEAVMNVTAEPLQWKPFVTCGRRR